MTYEDGQVGGGSPTAVPPRPGWYRDPGGQVLERWWDGTAWSATTRPTPWAPQRAAEWSQPTRPDPTTAMLLPVGRSGWAIASGYLGLVSILFVTAPLALLTGVFALSDIRRHPHKLGRGRAIFGIVMGGLFSLVGVVGFLVARAG